MSDIDSQNNRIIDKISIFFIGLINTAPSLVLNFASQNVLVRANYEHYFLIFFWVNTLIVLVSRFLINVLVSLNIRYNIIILANIVLMLLGFAICSFAFNFFTVLACVVITNFSTSGLDSAILCFITSRRKNDLLKFWGCGLGFAGLISAGYSYLCAKIDVSMFWTVIAFVFLPVIYVLLFYSVTHRSPKSDFVVCSSEKSKSNSNNNKKKKEKKENTYFNAISEPMLNENAENPYENPNHPDNEDDSIISHVEKEEKPTKVCVCNLAYFHKSWGLILNFSFIYLLYRLVRGIIDLYGLRHEMDNVYTIPYFNLCFHIGFFLSVCSIFVIVIKKIWIFTIIQIAIFGFSCAQALLHFTKNLVFYPVLFVFGLCCGFSYINAIYLMMNDETKNTKQREMVISWSMFLLSLFVILSTAILYLIELFFYHNNH